MANFQTNETSSSTFDAAASFNTRSSSRSGTRDMSIFGSSFKKSDLVGINAGKARQTADLIVEKINGLMQTISGLNVDQSTLSNAIQSQEIQDKLKTYIEKEKELLQAIVSDLKAFADKLYEIAKAWEEGASTFANNTISGATSSNFSDVTNAYSTQYTSSR